MFSGLVKITICEAKDLRVTDYMMRFRNFVVAPTSGKVPSESSHASLSLDPYVTIDVDDENKDRTQAKIKTFDPQWNESFEFRVTGALQLGLKVFHVSTVGTDDFVADATVSFEDVINEHQNQADLWVRIRYFFTYMLYCMKMSFMYN